MRPPKYPADEVVRILELNNHGWTVAELCKEHGISIQTWYRWKQRFGDVTPDQAPKLRELELENARLKRVKKKTSKEIKILGQVLERAGEMV